MTELGPGLLHFRDDVLWVVLQESEQTCRVVGEDGLESHGGGCLRAVSAVTPTLQPRLILPILPVW